MEGFATLPSLWSAIRVSLIMLVYHIVVGIYTLTYTVYNKYVRISNPSNSVAT